MARRGGGPGEEEDVDAATDEKNGVATAHDTLGFRAGASGRRLVRSGRGVYSCDVTRVEPLRRIGRAVSLFRYRVAFCRGGDRKKKNLS